MRVTISRSRRADQIVVVFCMTGAPSDSIISEYHPFAPIVPERPKDSEGAVVLSDRYNTSLNFIFACDRRKSRGRGAKPENSSPIPARHYENSPSISLPLLRQFIF